MQQPTSRSSHTVPTSAGGGIAIAVLGSVAGYYWGIWQIASLAALLAVLGLLDDRYHLSNKLRFVVQAVVIAVLLHTVGVSISNAFGLYVGFLLFLGLWWVNLFNFMDGIDGLAGSQAVFMLLAAVALGAWYAPAIIGSVWWLWMLVIVAASLGFLVMNWPPAKIFMGDVGSMYLGLMLFAFALVSIQAGWLSYAVWLIIAAVFVSDATVTLVTRILRGDSWTAAHRSHAYQRLARRWQSHQRVTLLVIAIDLLWLAPLAWCSLRWPTWVVLCVLLAYLPLLIGAVVAGAGRADHA